MLIILFINWLSFKVFFFCSKSKRVEANWALGLLILLQDGSQGTCVWCPRSTGLACPGPLVLYEPYLQSEAKKAISQLVSLCPLFHYYYFFSRQNILPCPSSFVAPCCCESPNPSSSSISPFFIFFSAGRPGSYFQTLIPNHR